MTTSWVRLPHRNSRRPRVGRRLGPRDPGAMGVDAPNHGYLLRYADDVVAVPISRFYSRREIRGQHLDICNLAAWCVLEEHRFSGLRLLKALLAQEGTSSPTSPRAETSCPSTSGWASCPEHDDFSEPHPLPVLSRAKVSSDPDVVDAHLDPANLQIYLDHRATAAARHAVVIAGDRDVLRDVPARPPQGPTPVRHRPLRQRPRGASTSTSARSHVISCCAIGSSRRSASFAWSGAAAVVALIGPSASEDVQEHGPQATTRLSILRTGVP